MKIKSQRNFDKLLSFANFKNFNTIIINLWEQNFIHTINTRTFPTTSSKTSIITHNLEFKVKNVFEFIKVMCYIHHANIKYFYILFNLQKRIECCNRKNSHSIYSDRLPNYRISKPNYYSNTNYLDMLDWNYYCNSSYSYQNEKNCKYKVLSFINTCFQPHS